MLPATAILFLFLVVLFAAIVGWQLLGFRIARQRRASGTADLGKGTTAVTGSLFALLGLLVAFSISGGETRLDARRHLMIDEANSFPPRSATTRPVPALPKLLSSEPLGR